MQRNAWLRDKRPHPLGNPRNPCCKAVLPCVTPHCHLSARALRLPPADTRRPSRCCRMIRAPPSATSSRSAVRRTSVPSATHKPAQTRASCASRRPPRTRHVFIIAFAGSPSTAPDDSPALDLPSRDQRRFPTLPHTHRPGTCMRGRSPTPEARWRRSRRTGRHSASSASAPRRAPRTPRAPTPLSAADTPPRTAHTRRCPGHPVAPPLVAGPSSGARRGRQAGRRPPHDGAGGRRAPRDAPGRS